MPSTKRLPKVTEYVKNVGKSIAFLTIDEVKKNASGINDFIDTNEDIFKEVFTSAKNYRATIRAVDKSIKQSKVYTAVEAGIKNLIEDAKTGNFYNDRSKYDPEYGEKALGFDFDDEDEDFEVSYSSNTSESQKLSDSFSEAIGAAATSQNTIVAESAGMVINANRASTRLILGRLDRTAASITSSVGSVYSAVSNVGQFLSGPLSAHMENSKRFYEENIKQTQEINSMLKEMLEMQRNLYKAKEIDRKESSLRNSMNYDGSINVRGYAKTIKGNIKDIASSLGLDMLNMDMGEGSNPYMLWAAAPFKLIMPAVVDRMMSKDFKKALSSFDKGVTTLFSQFLARMNTARRNDDGGFLSILGKIFGVSIDTKDSISTGNYKKDAVPFDGITRQSIIETIPGYLARIEAALTGSGERYYDYQSGNWKSAKKIKDDYDYDRNQSIANAAWRFDLEIEKKANAFKSNGAGSRADYMQKRARNTFEKIYNDGGDFRTDHAPGDNFTDAYKYYGYKSQKDFEKNFLEPLGKMVREIPSSFMAAREDLSRQRRMQENDGGPQRHLFNGTFDLEGQGNGKRNDPSQIHLKGSGLLASSLDSHGRNVFWYLNTIIDTIRNCRIRKSAQTTSGISRSRARYRGRARATFIKDNASTSESSSDDPDPDGGYDISNDNYDPLEDNYKEAKKQAEEEEEKKKSKGLGDWLNEKFEKTRLGRALSKVVGSNGLLAKPMQFMTKMINKADESLFNFMYGGKKELKDRNGKTVKGFFPSLLVSMDNFFTGMKNKFEEWWRNNKTIKAIKEKFHKFADPIKDEVKSMGKSAWGSVKTATSETYGKAFGLITDKIGFLKDKVADGDVHSAEEIVNDAKEGNVGTNARGGIVTKRGLTMISPGEMIIPASFDKKEQQKMLNLEKRDRNKIYKAIGLNAAGTVNTDELKDNLTKMYRENKGKAARNAAGGILGAGAGFLMGNPLLGALAGAGLSFLSNSETFKKMLFGEVDEKTGEQIKKGILPKSLTKALPDMKNFAIAGGVAGLIAPFGILGGAALGAGVGLLKNSEGFKNFIFGEKNGNGDREGGLISKESFDKAKAFVTKNAPKAAIGAIAGAFLGPFGLLGNLALGAGAGLITGTSKFHKFLFGDKEDERGGVVGAFKEGILNPAKEKIKAFLDDFKGYAKRNILDPMKNFWNPLKQGLQNIVTGTIDGVKDKLNDIFENTLGIPIHDWLQEKLFKPVTKLVFGILKAPYTLAKGVVAAPFRALGGIGNITRMNQIRKGKATNMSASERLAWRDEHDKRSSFFSMFGGDKMRQQDEILAGMTDEQIQELATNSGASLDNMRTLQKKKETTRRSVGDEFSKYMNAKVDGKSRFSRVNYTDMKKAIDRILDNDTGDLSVAEKEINNIKGLSESERGELLNLVGDKVKEAATASKTYADAGSKTSEELDSELSKLLGREIKGRKDRRLIYRNAQAELKARSAAAGKKSEADNASSPEEAQIIRLREKYEEKTDQILDLFRKTSEYLQDLADPEAAKERKRQKAAAEAQERMRNMFNSDSSADEETAAKSGTESVENVDEEGNKISFSERFADANAKGRTAWLNLKDKINPFKFLKKKKGIDSEDSKEATDEKKKEEKKEEEQKKTNEAILQTAANTEATNKTLFGSFKEKKDKAKGAIGGLLGNIGTTLSGIFGFMGGPVSKIAGFGLKALGIGAGVSLLGYASEFAKNSIVSPLGKMLFGEKDENGNRVSNGLLTGVGDKLRNLFYGNGTDNKPGGILGWIREHIIEPFNAFREKGLARTIGEDILPKMVTGWGLAIENIVTPLVAILVKNLPSILFSLGKAILQGLKIAIFDRKIKRSAKEATIDNSEPLKELSDFSNSKNSSLAKQAGNKVSNAFGKTSSSVFASSSSSINFSKIFGDNNIDADETYDSKGNKLNKSSDEILYERAPGVAGLLGARKHTNQVIYDENGNIALDSYSRTNTEDSALSRVWGSTKTAFRNAFLTGKANPIAAAMANKTVRFRGPGLASKAITGGSSAMIKGAGTAMNTGSKAGLGLRNWLNSFLDPDDVVNVGSRMTGGVKDAVTNTKLGSKLAKKAATKNAMGEFADIIVESSGKKGKKANKLRKKILKNISDYGSEGVEDAYKYLKKDITEDASKRLVDLAEDSIKPNAKISLKGKAKLGIKNTVKKGTDAIKDSAVGTAVKSAKEAASKTAVGGAIKSAAKSVGGIGEKISGFFKGITENSTIMKYLRKASGKADDVIKNTIGKLADKIGSTAVGKLGKKAITKVAGVLNKLAWPIWIASCVYDFLKGYNNADTILGVAKGDSYKISFGQKVICGLLNLVNEQLLLGLIPLDVIADIFIEFLAPLFNIDVSDLQAARDRADDVLDQWNKEHPEEQYDNLEDYNDKDKWTTKAKKGIKKFFGNAWETTKETAGKVWNKTKELTSTGFEFIKKGVPKAIKTYKDSTIDADEVVKKVQRGEFSIFNKKYWDIKKPSTKEDEEDPLSKIGTVFSYISRITKAPTAMIGYLTSKIKGTFEKLIGSATGTKDFIEDANKVKYDVEDGKYTIFNKKYWTINAKGDGIFGVLGKITGYVYRISNAPMLLLDSIKNTFSGWFKKFKDWIFGTQDDIEEVENADVGSGSSKTTSGKGREFQNHPIYQNIKYGDSTIAKSGCAPVAASNLVDSIKPGTSSVFEAANFAEKNNMTVPGGGTDIKFFNRYFKKHGINSVTTDNKAAIQAAIKQGNSVVLLGKDTSDKGQPFGTNPHFITVKGIDRNGNYIVDDPDFEKGEVLYSKNRVLNSTISSIITGTNANILKPNKKLRGKGRRLWGAGAFWDKVTAKDSLFPEIATEDYNEENGTNLTTDEYIELRNNENNQPNETADDQAESTEESSSETSVSALMSGVADLGAKYLKKMFGNAYDAIFGDTDSNEDGEKKEKDSNTSSDNWAKFDLNDTSHKKLANYLINQKGYTKSAVAGILGNLDAESGVQPDAVEIAAKQDPNRLLNTAWNTDESYVNAVDDGSMSKDKFISDASGFGLAQWTDKSRKTNLYDLVKSRKVSIADLQAQADQLDKEIHEYGIFDEMNSGDVRSASNTMLHKFERPRDQSERVENARYEKSQAYLDNVINKSGEGRATRALNQYRYSGSGRPTVYYGGAGSATRSVGSVDYSTFLQTIVSVLMTIAGNTGVLNEILKLLSEKFNINMTKEQVQAATRKSQEQTMAALNNLVKANGGNKSVTKLLNNQDTDYIFAAMAAIAKE